ncbi:MAG: alpha/beta hydrolase [Lysobacter sp.]
MLLVHGGGWRRGDKAAGNVLAAKVARWTDRGIVVISTDYRMLPGADPLTQSRDVGRAVAAAQRHSARWGGHPDRFVLVGHSARCASGRTADCRSVHAGGHRRSRGTGRGAARRRHARRRGVHGRAAFPAVRPGLRCRPALLA